MSDNINSPKHYRVFPGVETKELVKACLEAMSQLSNYEAYLVGTEIAYRLRAGHKGDAVEDIAKAMKYYEFRMILSESKTPYCDRCNWWGKNDSVNCTVVGWMACGNKKSESYLSCVASHYTCPQHEPK